MTEENLCPHCGTKMDPIATPLESSWGGEIHYVCFNDECGYFVDSWDSLESQGVENAGYRCRLGPRGECGPMAVWSKDALKNLILKEPGAEPTTLDHYEPSDFARDDETPDPAFYEKSNIVEHMDSLALTTIQDLLEDLVPPGSRVLDLMAGADSHLKDELKVSSVTGVALNPEELNANASLADRIIHDVNETPVLPFPDDEFDAALLTVSIQYVTRPIELFREVARVLKARKRFIVVFSNRMFPPKAVQIWKNTDEGQRVTLVKEYFKKSESFLLEDEFESKGKPRPQDDPFYSMGIPSDPVYAIWAESDK